MNMNLSTAVCLVILALVLHSIALDVSKNYFDARIVEAEERTHQKKLEYDMHVYSCTSEIVYP